MLQTAARKKIAGCRKVSQKEEQTDFGLLLAFRNPRQWARPFADLYQAHIDQAALAEALGYDHPWTTEHHFAEDAYKEK